MTTPAPFIAEVLHTERLSAHMVRIVVGGPGLAGFEAGAFADEYLKLHVPPQGATYAPPFDMQDIRERLPREHWPSVRTYTVRRWDADAGELTIDFVVHGDSGVAGPWALRAQPGDRLQFWGPGGAYTPGDGHHLLIGDLAVVPAIAATLERLPDGATAQVVIGIETPEDELDLPVRDGIDVRWVADADLEAAVRELELPSADVSVFLHGEAELVRAIRRHLVAERGIPREGQSISGYWKQRLTEEGWREDKAEWQRLVEADDAAIAT